MEKKKNPNDLINRKMVPQSEVFYTSEVFIMSIYKEGAKSIVKTKLMVFSVAIHFLLNIKFYSRLLDNKVSSLCSLRIIFHQIISISLYYK